MLHAWQPGRWAPPEILRSTILAEAVRDPLNAPEHKPAPAPAQWRRLLPPWGAALLLSALLVWAGQRWPTPLLEQAWAQRQPEAPFWLALALVVLPPLLIGLWLLRGLRRHAAAPPSNPDRGESFD